MQEDFRYRKCGSIVSSRGLSTSWIAIVHRFWCRGVRVRRCWAVRLHINVAELPEAGGLVQDWQEIVIWPNLGNFWVCCSILDITLATSIRFAHITQIWKDLFGAHVVATQLRSVHLVSSPKICCFPFQKPNFRFFFLSIYGNFSCIV
jgi:hypothetical protein